MNSTLDHHPETTTHTTETTDPAKRDLGLRPTMIGALAALIFANSMQIAAGLAGIDPSPPADVLPLLAATVALGLAALPMVWAGQRSGLNLGIAFCLVSMIGMGPHKLFLEDGAIIAPMALVGFAFEIVFIQAALRSR